MHAYYRMEADQTDSIAVCATKEEWQEIVDFLFENAPTTLTGDTAAWKLIEGLEDWGIN